MATFFSPNSHRDAITQAMSGLAELESSLSKLNTMNPSESVKKAAFFLQKVRQVITEVSNTDAVNMTEVDSVSDSLEFNESVYRI